MATHAHAAAVRGAAPPRHRSARIVRAPAGERAGRSAAPDAARRSLPPGASSRAAPGGRAFLRRSRIHWHDRGQGLRHGAHRSALQPLRRTPRPRLPGRPAADRAPLLHQRRGVDLRADDVSRAPDMAGCLHLRQAGIMKDRTPPRTLTHRGNHHGLGACPSEARDLSRRHADDVSSSHHRDSRFSSSAAASRGSPLSPSPLSPGTGVSLQICSSSAPDRMAVYRRPMQVGLIGWRGMVGSVLVQRMREERDFDLIDPCSSRPPRPGPPARDW